MMCKFRGSCKKQKSDVTEEDPLKIQQRWLSIYFFKNRSKNFSCGQMKLTKLLVLEIDTNKTHEIVRSNKILSDTS